MSETRERELVDAAKAVGSALNDWIRIVVVRNELNPDLRHYAWKRSPAYEEVQDAMRANNELRAAIEALSASTQVDAMREALEEAREAIGIYGYATVHGRRVRQSWATEALAKIDAALLSLPPGGEATSPAAQEDI